MAQIFCPPKISPPQLSNIVKRERLFLRLDAARKSPLVWIGSTAGSGKTSLVASYLKEKRLPTVWYQIDAGDGDIGSFFYYLSLASKPARNKKRIKLQPFTQEFKDGLAAFSHNYFRELFSGLKPGTVLVFDDYHAAVDHHLLKTVLQIAIDELPDTINIIVISRHEPPAETARLAVEGRLARINWQQMQLTFEECFSISKKRKQKNNITTDFIREVYQHTQGWVTGLILLLGRDYDENDMHEQWNLENKNLEKDLVYDYFSTEITKSIDKETLLFLMKAALLPTITSALAKQLTGKKDAKRILKKLASEQFFITRRGKIKINYDFHPLFLQFLRDRMEESFTEKEIETLKAKAGDLLAQTGNIEGAAELSIQSCSWETLALLITKHAKTLINQGRYVTVETWLRNMPKEIVAKNPQLLLWLGNSMLQTKPTEARIFVQEAYKLFLKKNDLRRAHLAWANIIDCYVFAWDTFETIPHWLSEFEKLQKNYTGILDIETRIRITFSAFSAMMHVSPEHPDMAAWVARTENIFRFVPIDFIQPMAGAQLSYYHMFMGNMEKHHNVIISMESIESNRAISPLPRLYSLITSVFYYMHVGDFAKAEEYQRRCKLLADRSGVHCFNFLRGATIVMACGINNRLNESKEQLETLKHLLCPERKLDHTLYLHLHAWTDLLNGDVDKAYESASYAHELVIGLNAQFPIHLNEILLGHVLIKQKNYSSAELNVNKVIAFAQKTKSPYFEFLALCTLSWIQLKTNCQKQADETISRALKIGRYQGIFSTQIWNPEMMSEICHRALESEIETHYVHNIICKRNLLPNKKSLVMRNWPWKLKIHTFGTFYIEINGDKLKVKGKAQSKALNLLKVLIVYGGIDVPSDKLKEALWPDADGDYAQQNYKTLLFRLRKLVGAECLDVSGGTLSLNQSYVWADTWVFKSWTDSSKDRSSLDEAYKELNYLYQGHFIQHDDEPWLIPAREKFKLLMLKTLKRYGQELINQNKAYEAALVFEAGIEIDQLTEELYKNLMHCQLMLGQNSEVAKTYMKCVNNLEAHLQIQPSEATQSLYKKIALTSTIQQNK